jgi:predicted transport protein
MTGKKDPKLQIYLKLSGDLAEDNEFSRDVSGIGHWGTGNFEVNVRTVADLEKAKELIIQSYERS